MRHPCDRTPKGNRTRLDAPIVAVEMVIAYGGIAQYIYTTIYN